MTEKNKMTAEEIKREIAAHLRACLRIAGYSNLADASFADSFSESLPVLLDGMGVAIRRPISEPCGCCSLLHTDDGTTAWEPLI